MKQRDTLVEEAKRQLANTHESYDATRVLREDNLQIAVAQQAYGRMLSILRSAAANLLRLGQARFVLDGDATQARAAFADLVAWMPYLEAARPGALSPENLHRLFEPVVCLLLANDWSSLSQVASLEWGSVKLAPKEYGAQFAGDLIGLLGPRDAAVKVLGRPPIPSKFVFAPYESLLESIANDDNASFDAHRARLEAAYPHRKSQREPGLNWYGYGELSQVCTFDALGTAICHLAARRGFQVDVDTPLYPRVFIRGTF